jgi:imidazolonepropionase-like amidohydrolase
MYQKRSAAYSRRMLLQKVIGRRTFLVGIAGAIACTASGGNRRAKIATVAVRDAQLWDGTGTSPRSGMTVAMLRETIIAIGRDEEIDLGRDTTVIDCAGAFVMPGIIDTHCHVTLTLVGREPLVAEWLRAGLTTIRDTGTIRQGTFLIRDLAKELGPAPRIIASGPIITVPGGYPITRPTIGEPISYPITTLDEATQAVNQVVDAGADFIKIAVEHGTPGGHLRENVGAPALNRPQVKAIVAAAHARGVSVSAHVTNYEELQIALAGGVDSMAHTPLDEIPTSVLQEMVTKGVTMTSTLNIWGGRPVVDEAMRNAQRFVAAGGQLAMGTDYPFQAQTGLPVEEMRFMESAGLTRSQVLLASTRDAARVCRRDDLGTIELGKRADLIVMQRDPLGDLNNLSSVSTVIQDGALIR